jgi:CBS domain-containing protein
MRAHRGPPVAARILTMQTQPIQPSSKSGAAPGTVAELMTRRVAVCRDDDSIAFAHQIMMWRSVRHLPIVDAKGTVVGILSDRDLLRIVVEGPAGAKPVREVMSHPVQTIAPETSVTEASAILCAGRIDALPVVKGGKLLGILTTTDVLAERGKLLHKGSSGGLPTAADVMHTRVLSASPTDTLFSALYKLLDAEIRHLPIVDDDYRVVGMLSDRDVRTAIGDPREALRRDGENDFLSEILVESVMTPGSIVVPATASVLEVADALLDEKIGALPVVDDGDKLIGIISYVDVLGHFAGRRR